MSESWRTLTNLNDWIHGCSLMTKTDAASISAIPIDIGDETLVSIRLFRILKLLYLDVLNIFHKVSVYILHQFLLVYSLVANSSDYKSYSSKFYHIPYSKLMPMRICIQVWSKNKPTLIVWQWLDIFEAKIKGLIDKVSFAWKKSCRK